MIIDVLAGGTLLTGRVVLLGLAGAANLLVPLGDACVRGCLASLTLVPRSMRAVAVVSAAGVTGLGVSLAAARSLLGRGRDVRKGSS